MKKLLLGLLLLSLSFAVNETRVIGDIVIARDTLISSGNASFATINVETLSPRKISFENSSIEDSSIDGNWDFNYGDVSDVGNLSAINIVADTITVATLNATVISGTLSGNASTATQLATARTIWGQEFNGTANVTGAISGATNITASGKIETTNTSADSFKTAGGVGISKNLNVGGNISVSGDSEIASDKYRYWGDKTIEGSWRLGRDGDDFVIQRYESGTWITNSTITK